jgi:hypothetical protein
MVTPMGIEIPRTAAGQRKSDKYKMPEINLDDD